MDRVESGDIYLKTMQAILTLNRSLRRYSKRMHSEQISGRQLAALRYLLENNGCAVGEIGRYLFISESSTSEQLAKLEEKAFIRRDRSAHDKRIVTVSITPAGKKVANRLPIGGILLLRERLGGLPDRELKAIHTSVAKLNDLLEESK